MGGSVLKLLAFYDRDMFNPACFQDSGHRHLEFISQRWKSILAEVSWGNCWKALPCPLSVVAFQN